MSGKLKFDFGTANQGNVGRRGKGNLKEDHRVLA
jgi:hypothetical protein